MSRHFLMLHEEAVYGTPVLTTSAPTTGRYHYTRLDQLSADVIKVNRAKVDVPRGDGYAGRGMVVKIPGGGVAASVRQVLCWSQAVRLLGFCGIKINSGKTAPWAVDSGQTVGDLASATLYEGIERSDGTIKRRAAVGCKVARWSLSCSRESPLAILSMELIGQKPKENDTLDGADSSDPDATEFPAPSATSYPTDPVLWQHLDGGLVIDDSGTDARSNFTSFTLEVDNALSPYHGTGTWLDSIRHFGARDVTVRTKMLHKATPDDRVFYESQTALNVIATFTSGTKSIVIDMNEANRISEPPSLSLTPGQWYEQDIVLASYRDTAASTDFTITVDDT
jgi:hypothetical protein